MQTLFASACVVLSLDGARHLTVRGLDMPIDHNSVSGMFDAMEALLEEKRPFSTTWDVRECPLPSVRVIHRVLWWALRKKRNLDEYNTRLEILCAPRLVGTVRFVLHAFGPTCPTTVDACDGDPKKKHC
jgi:hypothetical protein